MIDVNTFLTHVFNEALPINKFIFKNLVIIGHIFFLTLGHTVQKLQKCWKINFSPLSFYQINATFMTRTVFLKLVSLINITREPIIYSLAPSWSLKHVLGSWHQPTLRESIVFLNILPEFHF